MASVQIGKAYDDRQYKQALKYADALLKKHPNHGDTNSMKALTLNALGRKTEALALAKQALRFNVKSTVCWQVLAMIQKSQLNHSEAIKAFRQAWKLDNENWNLARDLATELMHTRDYQGALETRQALLAQKQNVNFNLLQFGYAHALAGNSSFATIVIDKYNLGAGTQDADGGKPIPASNGTDEIALYKLQAMEAAGERAKALAAATSPALTSLVVDGTALQERRARLTLSLGASAPPPLAAMRAAAAGRIYWNLLAINPDCLDYAAGWLECVVRHAGLHSALPSGPAALDADIRAVTLARACSKEQGSSSVCVAALLLASAQHPKCRTLRRLLLDALPVEHPLFKPCLAAYVRAGLRRGIPSLFSDVRHLARPEHAAGMAWTQRVAWYKANGGFTAKGSVLLDVVRAYHSACSSGVPLPVYAPDEAAVSAALEEAVAKVRACVGDVQLPSSLDLPAAVTARGDSSGAESPDVVPWAGLLLARCQDEAGQAQEGADTLTEVMKHTPTVIDLLMAQARMLKHLGQSQRAADVMDTARQLDSADRHVNNKTTEYLLRAGRIEQAEQTIGLFVRHDATNASDDPLATMRVLQVSWFDLALGAAWEAKGDLGPALVAYHRCMASQDSFVEDAMDYHAYCMRTGPYLRSHHDMLATNQSMAQHSTSLRAATALARCYMKLHLQPELRVVRERPVKESKKEEQPKKKESSEGEEGGEGEGKKPVFDPWGTSFLTSSAPSPLEQARKYAKLIMEGIPTSWKSVAAVELARTSGCVPTTGCAIDGPGAMVGVRANGWHTGLAVIADAALTAAEVEVQAEKAGQAASALQVAMAAISANAGAASIGAAAVPGGEARVQAVQRHVQGLAQAVLKDAVSEVVAVKA